MKTLTCPKCDSVTQVEDDYIFENCKECILLVDGLYITYQCENYHYSDINRLEANPICKTCSSNKMTKV